MLLPEIMFHRKIKGGQEVCLSFVKWEKGQCENGGGKGKPTNDGQISCRTDRLGSQIPKLGNL